MTEEELTKKEILYILNALDSWEVDNMFLTKTAANHYRSGKAKLKGKLKD